jgi:tripartite-type tricarboxylate transporter receptor subunit TctC
VLVIFGVAVCLTAAATQALAQTWPRQAIHFIISFGAGGGADIVGRILADAMQKRLGQSVVVENKPGAGDVHRT